MEKKSHPQCRIVPIRMLHPHRAAPFIEGIAGIRGIRRILVHGPSFSADHPGTSIHSCEIQPPEYTGVAIGDQIIDMHVLMADLIVEATDEAGIEQVVAYSSHYLAGIPFQVLRGQYIKTEPSLIDHMRNGLKQEDLLLGMSDSREQIEPIYLYPHNIRGKKL